MNDETNEYDDKLYNDKTNKTVIQCNVRQHLILIYVHTFKKIYIKLYIYIYIHIYRVSIKSLYNFKNLLQRQMKRQTSGKLLQNETYIFKFFLASFNAPLYGHQHFKTVLDFLPCSL